LLHVPQFCTLLVGSTQFWPHCRSVPQLVEHVPCAQTWLAVQTVPHVPQFIASD
jgi:hypothetical protein